MSKKTGYLLGMLLTIIICMILAYFFCCHPGASVVTADDNEDRNPVVATPDPTSLPFSIKGPDGNFAISSNDNFNFNVSNFDILTPLSEEVTGGIGELKAYFDTDGNENKILDITGLYDKDEENPSAYANLGIARANAIKNYLGEQGINSEHINTYGQLRESLVPDGNIYKGPVTYKLYAQAAEEKEAEIEELNKVAEAIKADPLVLHFDHGEASVNLSEEQRLKIGDISHYLDKVDGATITIEGHDSKIKTISKGEREPIASNDTEEGKAENRRVVITIN